MLNIENTNFRPSLSVTYPDNAVTPVSDPVFPCRLFAAGVFCIRLRNVPPTKRSGFLERFFYLDDVDRALIGKRRGDQNRLGFALQMCTVRYVGLFLEDPLAVPWPLIEHLGQELGIEDVACIKQYTERLKTAYEHAWEIRDAYGYHQYEDPESGRLFRTFLHGRASPQPWQQPTWGPHKSALRSEFPTSSSPGCAPLRRARSRLRAGRRSCLRPAPPALRRRAPTRVGRRAWGRGPIGTTAARRQGHASGGGAHASGMDGALRAAVGIVVVSVGGSHPDHLRPRSSRADAAQGVKVVRTVARSTLTP